MEIKSNTPIDNLQQLIYSVVDNGCKRTISKMTHSDKLNMCLSLCDGDVELSTDVAKALVLRIISDMDDESFIEFNSDVAKFLGYSYKNIGEQ